MNNDMTVRPTTSSAVDNLRAPKRGFEEETKREDLIIPRAKLLQALSPEVTDQPDIFRPGMIINSITKEVLPEVFIPIFKYTEWIRFNPRDKRDPNFDINHDPGKMMWRTNDPYDPRVIKEGEFGPNGEKPAATKFLNFFSIFPGHPMPIIVSFCNSSFKSGKQLLSIAKFSMGDMFSRKYKLTSKEEENDLGKYFVLKVEINEFCKEKEFVDAELLYEEFKAKPVKADQDEVSPEIE